MLNLSTGQKMKILERIIRRQARKETEPLERRIDALQRKVNLQEQTQAHEETLYEQFTSFEQRLYRDIRQYGICNDYGIANALNRICEAIHDIGLKSTIYDSNSNRQ